MPDVATPTRTRTCAAESRRRMRRAPGTVRPSDLLVAFFAVAVGWIGAGAAALAASVAFDVEHARWLAFHLAFVGGVSQLVVGAAQFFACAFLATEPPARRLIRVQLAVWNAATVAIAVGVPADVTALTGIGGALVLAGLALFAHSLRTMRRTSLQRQPWATRWYLTAAAWLALGAALGPVMAADALWTHGSLLGAHLAMNLGGWFGTAIVGTLHTFHPSLTGTRLRHPRLQQPTYAAWTAGIGLLAGGAAFAAQPVAIAGWTLLLAAAAMLWANLAASTLAAERHPPAAIVVAAGQAMLVIAVVAGLGITADGGATAALIGPDRDVVASLAVAGWVGLTVAGSLLHLLALMAHVRRLDRSRGAAAPDAPVLAATGTVAAGLLAATITPAGLALVAAGYAVLGARVAMLAIRAVRAAPLRV